MTNERKKKPIEVEPCLSFSCPLSLLCAMELWMKSDFLVHEFEIGFVCFVLEGGDLRRWYQNICMDFDLGLKCVNVIGILGFSLIS